MRLKYAGPGPHDDGRGGLVRPGDVWDWPEEPPWGPWEPVPDPQGAPEASDDTPPTPAPTGGADGAGAGQDAPGTDGSAGTTDTGTEA